ncbi:MAG TPA: HNH endonuclease, partial [Nodularia sp. (in: cyanobacteria)]|nr:HNH endonuclease [Nodularia sp. (in: cyanobacteria)]
SLLIEKYGMKCFWCEVALTTYSLTIDHFIPLSKGGNNKLKNLRTACKGCNNKRGNAMPEDTPEIIAQKSCIRFPSHWGKPKYHLGQRVKEGEIVGVEYYQPKTLRGYEEGAGWSYWVLRNDLSDQAEAFRESNISPLKTSELIEDIQSEIEFYQNKITALNEHIQESQQS